MFASLAQANADRQPLSLHGMENAPQPLPPKPQPPVDYDCCGGGCADCELRIYLRELQRWQKQARLLGIPLDD